MVVFSAGAGAGTSMHFTIVNLLFSCRFPILCLNFMLRRIRCSGKIALEQPNANSDFSLLVQCADRVWCVCVCLCTVSHAFVAFIRRFIVYYSATNM